MVAGDWRTSSSESDPFASCIARRSMVAIFRALLNASIAFSLSSSGLKTFFKEAAAGDATGSSSSSDHTAALNGFITRAMRFSTTGVLEVSLLEAVASSSH